MSDRPDDYATYLRALRSLDDLPARISGEHQEADERLRATLEAAQQQHADLEASADRLRQQADQLLTRGRTILEPVDRQGLIPSKVRAKGEPGELATAERSLVKLQATVHKLEEHRQAARERRLAEAKAREQAVEAEARQRRLAEERRREAERRAEQARKRSRLAAMLGAVLTVAAGAIASLQAPTIGVIVLVVGAITTASTYLLLQRQSLEDPNDDDHHRPGGS